MRERDGEGARQRGRERDTDVTAVTVKSGEQLFPFAGTRAWLSFSRATREPFHWPGDHPPTPPPPPPTDAGPPSRRRRPIKHVLPRSPNARRTQPPNEFDYNFSSGFPPLKPPPPPPPPSPPLSAVCLRARRTPKSISECIKQRGSRPPGARVYTQSAAAAASG